MADKNKVQELEGGEVAIAKARDFWSRYNKPIMIASAVIILLGGGWLVYRNFVQLPNEKKGAEAMFMAEEYFRMDSVNLALNGDGQHQGFLRIISKYGSTDAGNLAHLYAGSCYLKLGDNDNAIKHLKKFSTNAKQVQARAYKLLGDAYADKGTFGDAMDFYKKSARHFEDDKTASAEALFMAATLAADKVKNQKEAIELFKELKEKFPQTQQGFEADNYLAQLGVYNVN